MLRLVRRKLLRLYGAGRICVNHLRRKFAHCNLHVTYRCNFRCQICDYWKEKRSPSEELSLEEFRLISRKLRRHGPMVVSIAGGEPMLRPDIFDIIAVVVDDGHLTFMTTNGWFVDDTAAKGLYRAGLEEPLISLDYADAAKHDEQRGVPGAWDRAVGALESLARHRPRGRRLHIVTVLMHDNLDELEGILGIAREVGATVYLTLYAHSRGTRPRVPRGTKVSARLLDLKRRHAELGSTTSYLERLDTAIANGGIGNCCAGDLLLNVGCGGSVSRCLELPGESVGNILTDSVPVLQRRLSRLRTEKPCSECWVACRGFAEALRTPPRRLRLKEVRCR
jgi:MoaA/NifB/PqqE/SkfB family radical SAM enzyme